MTLAVDPLSAAAFLAVIAAQGALWYKLGKVEQAVKNHQATHEEDHRVYPRNRPGGDDPDQPARHTLD